MIEEEGIMAKRQIEHRGVYMIRFLILSLISFILVVCNSYGYGSINRPVTLITPITHLPIPTSTIIPTPSPIPSTLNIHSFVVEKYRNTCASSDIQITSDEERKFVTILNLKSDLSPCEKEVMVKITDELHVSAMIRSNLFSKTNELSNRLLLFIQDESLYDGDWVSVYKRQKHGFVATYLMEKQVGHWYLFSEDPSIESDSDCIDFPESNGFSHRIQWDDEHYVNVNL